MKRIDMSAELAMKANDFWVQVIIQGMECHVDPNLIPNYVAHYKRKTYHMPLFVAGPLPIDIGVGYDHISQDASVKPLQRVLEQVTSVT
jgi:phosphomethylpyrimidine synthase